MLLVSSLTLLAALGVKAQIVPRSQSVGAAYWITNEPSGNNVVAAAIDSQGMLSSTIATTAGGVGLHSRDVGAPGGDPLNSQGSVQVSGRYLYTVNSGSNTVVMFSINPRDPTHITMVGHPVSSGGEFPVSVAVSRKTGVVCALNGGAKSGVNCFLPHQNDGLAPLPGTIRSFPLNQTTPPLGPPGTASQISFSEYEDKLIVAVKGTPPTPGYFAVWDVSVAGGAWGLSKSYHKVVGGMLPFSLTAVPHYHDVFLSADPGAGYTLLDLGKAKATVIPVPGQKAVCWSAYSKRTGNFYLSDAGTGIVDEVAVTSSTKGTLVKQYSLGNGTAPLDPAIATIGGKDFLYILTIGNATTIKVLSLQGAGKATQIQTFSPTAGVKMSPLNVQGMAVFTAW